MKRGALAVALLVAALCAWPTPALERRAITALARVQAAELARDAALDPAAPLAVEPLAAGGPVWMTEAVRDALPVPGLREDARAEARLVATVDGGLRAFAMGLQLVRRGWGLHAPRRRLRVAPWILVLGVAITVAPWWSRRAWGWVGAAAAMQVIATLAPWPSPLARVSWWEQVRQGPGAALLGDAARALTPAATAALVAAGAAAAIAAWWFERWRSRGTPGGGLEGVVIAVALVAGADAAARCAVGPWLGMPQGVAGALACVAALLLASRNPREEGRAA